MTKKDLVKIIREVVKREVKNQIDNILTEMETKKTSKMSINEAIDNTEAYPTMKTFNAADARAGFAAMQTGFNQTPQQTDLKGNPVDVKSLGGGLDKVLTRDYSELVKKMSK